MIFALHAFDFFQRSSVEEAKVLQLPVLQEDDRLYKNAMRNIVRCCGEKKNRVLSSIQDAEIPLQESAGDLPHPTETRFTEEAGVLRFNNGSVFQNEEIGNADTEVIRLEAGAEIKIKGRVSLRAKKIIILGFIDADFPIHLEKDSYRADQSFLELNAAQEVDVSGIIFLRHYFKNSEQHSSLTPSYVVRAVDKAYRLKISAEKVSVRGLVSMSQDDLSPFGANVWVTASDWQTSFVSASSFDRAEHVDFNSLSNQVKSAAR